MVKTILQETDKIVYRLTLMTGINYRLSGWTQGRTWDNVRFRANLPYPN